LPRFAHGASEGGLIGDETIGRRHGQEGIGQFRRDIQPSYGNRRRRVVPEGLEQEGCRQAPDVDQTVFIIGLEVEITICDREDFRHVRDLCAAQDDRNKRMLLHHTSLLIISMVCLI